MTTKAKTEADSMESKYNELFLMGDENLGSHTDINNNDWLAQPNVHKEIKSISTSPSCAASPNNVEY